MRTSRASFALLAIAVGLSARAETYTFTLKDDPGTKRPVCGHGALPSAKEPEDRIVVKLEGVAGVAPLDVHAPADGKDAPFARSGNDWSILKSRLGKTESFQLRVHADPGQKDPRDCDEIQLPADRAAPPGPVATAVDAGMASWWQSEGQGAIDALRTGAAQLRGAPRFPDDTHFLVHYANGEPAPPYPASLPEGEPIQIAVVVEDGKPLQASLTVNACEGIQPFRVKEAAAAAAGKPRAGVVRRTFVLVAYGRTMACGAGTLSYTLRLNDVDHVQSLRIRPVYHLAATAAYGFDFSRPPTFAARSGVVTRSADRAGLGLRLGFTWFPWGIDYEDVKWFNGFTNFVFAVDPNAPTENFMAGVGLTPTGGLSLLVGMNFRRATVLKGTSVGAPFTGPGDVPTDKAWNNDGVGLYLGLAVDDDVFKAMKGRLGVP